MQKLNVPNRVVPVLSGLALLPLALLDFAIFQPNRIAPGTGFGFIAALGAGGWALAMGIITLAALSWWPGSKRYHWIFLVASLLVLSLPLGLSWFAHSQVPLDQPYARAGIGAATWSLLFFLTLILIEARQQLKGWRSAPLWVVTGFTLVLLACFYAGWLDTVSLVREYQSQPDQFTEALVQHLILVAGAVGVSLFLGFLLAVQVSRRPRWHKPVFGVLNFFQTIPSLALFGLLIAPLGYLASQWPLLRQLNIQGIGWAPAILALIGYSLLPIARNAHIALVGVSPSLLEAGRGMGMSPRQIFFQVRLPLALPVIIEGVRVTTIQAIGLTAVAALIGAGGLGEFIFQGLGQAAMDLILLGALPTIALAVLADIMLSWMAARLRT